MAFLRASDSSEATGQMPPRCCSRHPQAFPPHISLHVLLLIFWVPTLGTLGPRASFDSVLWRSICTQVWRYPLSNVHQRDGRLGAAEMSTQKSECKSTYGVSGLGTFRRRLLPMASRALSLLTNILFIQRPFPLFFFFYSF